MGSCVVGKDVMPGFHGNCHEGLRAHDNIHCVNAFGHPIKGCKWEDKTAISFPSGATFVVPGDTVGQLIAALKDSRVPEPESTYRLLKGDQILADHTAIAGIFGNNEPRQLNAVVQPT